LSLLKLDRLKSYLANDMKYFSLARCALKEALIDMGCQPGDVIYVPEFICREAIEPIFALGMTIEWYKLDTSLRPIFRDQNNLKAILIVNYFGMPQFLEDAEKLALKNKASIIEDNSHGFLSCDQEYNWLGTRCDYGLFSFRKTLMLPDGAALYRKRLGYTFEDNQAVSKRAHGIYRAQRWKILIREIPFVGRVLYPFVKCAYQLGRFVLDLRKDPSKAVSIKHMTCLPWRDVRRRVSTLDFAREIGRRRILFKRFLFLSRFSCIEPIFSNCEPCYSPYGFAFYRKGANLTLIRLACLFLGLDILHWPELPDAVQTGADTAHYHDVYVVNFL
jgi:hypothetical protein